MYASKLRVFVFIISVQCVVVCLCAGANVARAWADMENHHGHEDCVHDTPYFLIWVTARTSSGAACKQLELVLQRSCTNEESEACITCSYFLFQEKDDSLGLQKF
jgi:hypothetical protein